MVASSFEVDKACEGVPGVERIGSEGPRARIGVPERVGGLLGVRFDRLVFLCGGGGTGDFVRESLDIDDRTVATGRVKRAKQIRTPFNIYQVRCRVKGQHTLYEDKRLGRFPPCLCV